ncbi:MAG: 6-bladed beta-propeller [Planctomycetota bacterium]|nr:6-bladed beta-propeller [Planctomycetota bacterium]
MDTGYQIPVRGFGRPVVLLLALALAVCVCAWALIAGLSGQHAATTSAPRQTPAWFAVGTLGLEQGQFQQPRGIATFPDGSFVVVDRAARVQHFAADGTPLRLWSMKDRAAGNPKGLCALPNGNLLVCDTHYGRVLEMSVNGPVVKTWGGPGCGPGQFTRPLSAVADAGRKVAYVVEYGYQNDRVQKFALDGTFIRAWGTFGSENGQFQRPSGVALDADGNVYVADACNHRIQKFDADGGFLKAFGRMGREPGQLRYPYDIACGRDGLLYVAEFNNHRVSVFDREGVFVRVIGAAGNGENEFANPWSLAVDARGRLLVSDTGNHRVQILDLGQAKCALNATAVSAVQRR